MWIKTLAVVALGLTSVASTAGGGQSGEPMYNIYNYSDATHTELVGQLHPTCTFRGGRYEVIYSLTGSLSNYQFEEFIGYCPNEPIQ